MRDSTAQTLAERDGILPARRRFTADEYCRMVETGILGPDERVELLNGEIWLMAPIGGPHMTWVNILTERLVLALAGRAVVSVQNAVRLSSGAMPQPDLALLRPPQSRYRAGPPRPEDVFLVIEVSDTTFRFDAQVKLPLYAEAGIPEAWVADLERGRVLTHRDPAGSAYRRVETVGREGTLSPAAFPDLVIPVADLLG